MAKKRLVKVTKPLKASDVIEEPVREDVAKSTRKTSPDQAGLLKPKK